MAIASKITITIDGKELKDFLSLQIEQSIYCPHRFQVVCRRDALETEDGFLVDRSVDQIGSPINISIEGVGSSNSQFFFKGIITGLTASGNYGNAEIIIKGNSTDILICDKPRCQSYEGYDLRKIADQILAAYPKDLLNAKLSPDNSDTFPYIVQYKENNYDFLRRLSLRYGEWFYNDGTQLIFGPPSKDKVNMILGLDLNSFDISLKLDPLNFKYTFYDYLKPDSVTSESSSVDPSNNLNDTGKRMYEQSRKRFGDEASSVFHHLNGAKSNYQAELNDVVSIEKTARAINMTNISGSSTVFIKLGNVVGVKAKKAVASLGDIDYGEYLVTEITHTCDNLCNYQNKFVGIPSEAMIPPYADPGSKPWCETQGAIVKDRQDPENLGRVKVNFFWQDSQQLSPWLRLASLNAGKSRGFFSVPEVGEEVLIGFEGGDAERPYIIGSLYNKDSTPHSDGKDIKDLKYIRTQNGSTLVFDQRDGIDRIVLQNGEKDQGNRIELNFKDKKLSIISTDDLILAAKNIHINAKEQIFMNAEQKMTISTDKDNLTIKSGKAVEINGTGGVNVNGDTKIQGGNVTIKGDAKVSAEGAQVSINGSGITEIKGGMVKIN
jgi:type VI secretion system secreted protein VgrG